MKVDVRTDRTTFVILCGDTCLDGRWNGYYTWTREPLGAWSFTNRGAALACVREVFVDCAIRACVVTRHEARKALGKLLEGTVDA